jgi:hypothetical protein
MPGYSQLMWSQKTDVIGSCDLYYRAATPNNSFYVFFLAYPQKRCFIRYSVTIRVVRGLRCNSMNSVCVTCDSLCYS